MGRTSPGTRGQSDEAARQSALDEHLVAGAAAEPVAVVPGLAVWSVEIPGCLLGQRYVQAADEAGALDAYRAPAGITAHAHPAAISLTDFRADNLPEGVELYG